MPKVIHILRKFRPDQWGGIETHLVGLLPELARLGWQSEVHAPEEEGTDGTALVRAGATFRTFRAMYPYAGMGAGERAALVASSGNLVSIHEMRQLLGEHEASILHTHTQRRLGGVVRMAARLRAIPYAVTIHGPLREGGDVIDRDLARRNRKIVDLGAPFGWLVGSRRVVEDADLVFALNRREHDAWAEERRGRHLGLARLGVDPTPTSPEVRREARACLAGVGDAPLIVVVGRLESAKGQDLALEAFLNVAKPGYHLVIAGAAVDPVFGEKLRLLAQADRRRVHFLGNVSPAIARGLLAEASLALVPSRVETFGLALLEGWAEGVPALFSEVGGLADIARQAGCSFGLVRHASVDAWTAALREALERPDLLAAERRAGPRRVARDFTWRAFAEETARAYAAAVSPARARASQSGTPATVGFPS